jgi:hypothetical protein
VFELSPSDLMVWLLKVEGQIYALYALASPAVRGMSKSRVISRSERERFFHFRIAEKMLWRERVIHLSRYYGTLSMPRLPPQSSTIHKIHCSRQRLPTTQHHVLPSLQPYPPCCPHGTSSTHSTRRIRPIRQGGLDCHRCMDKELLLRNRLHRQ